MVAFELCECDGDVFVLELDPTLHGYQASRHATPMKAIDLTVFLVELGVPSCST